MDNLFDDSGFRLKTTVLKSRSASDEHSNTVDELLASAGGNGAGSEHRDRSPGIIFRHGSNGELYIPYALLTLIEFKSETELEFRFSFCTVRVRGERLKSVFDHAARGQIIKLNPNDRKIAIIYKQPHISSIEVKAEDREAW